MRNKATLRGQQSPGLVQVSPTLGLLIAFLDSNISVAEPSKQGKKQSPHVQGMAAEAACALASAQAWQGFAFTKR